MGSMCQSAYHGRCFQQGEKDPFPVLSLKDLDNSLVDDSTMVDKDPTWFKEGRDGDHFLVPFQCDTCHFLNIQGCLPIDSDKQDELLRLEILRVSLDSL